MFFPRPQIAEEMCDELQGLRLLSDAPNGLFLAAPRRTGKSTFLQNDLLSALEKRNVVVIYVDLWAAPHRDPAEFIAEAIGLALQKHSELVTKAAKASGLESISLLGAVKIDLQKIGKVDGTSLVDALRALHELSRSPIALIIDEAQHSLTSVEGEYAMTALKSARDQINRPGVVNLMLVMSGSDRDKLLRLVNSNAAAFYGSTIKHLPLLNRDFVENLALLIEKQRPELVLIDVDKLLQVFDLLGHRPQFFIEILSEALSPWSALNNERFEDVAVRLAKGRLEQDRLQLKNDYFALRPLEQAIIWRMLEQGPRFRPYDIEALQFYAGKTGQPVQRGNAQKAMESLRNRQPSIIWKSAKGEYAIDDAATHQWYRSLVESNSWPPTPKETIPGFSNQVNL